jgi:hypothetical protein
MSEQARFEAFMQRVMQRPMPANPMARIRTLARELAEGVTEGLWELSFMGYRYAREEPELLEYLGDQSDTESLFLPESPLMRRYFKQRWNAPIEFLEFDLLEINGYMVFKPISGAEILYDITKAAFDLIEEVVPTTIFISYRRKDSSALALLVLKSLKEAGLNAFLDMTIQPGDDWHAYIHKQIEAHDFFVLLIGKETLASEVVRDEILWAKGTGATILPLWHNGFVYRPEDWENLPPEIARVLETTHTIRVLEESVLAYNNAIVELLNRFGITP